MNDLLAGEPIPIEQQIREVNREIEMREKVYPRQVDAHRMQQHVADQRILNMKAVLETLLRVQLRSGGVAVDLVRGQDHG